MKRFLSAVLTILPTFSLIATPGFASDAANSDWNDAYFSIVEVRTTELAEEAALDGERPDRFADMTAAVARADGSENRGKGQKAPRGPRPGAGSGQGPADTTDPSRSERGGGGGRGFGGDDGGGFSSGGGMAGVIINAGKAIWSVIVENAPSATSKLESANALPRGAMDWQEVTGWKLPAVKVFQKDFINGFGQAVVSFKYRIHYTYGGNYRGVGQYLNNISVQPADLQVSYGFKVSVDASVPNVINMGTVDAPIAAAELLLDMKVDSLIKHNEVSMDYYIAGDGSIQDLSGGN